MNNSLSEEGAALMNEEMRVSWGMDTDGCSMYAIKVEREITETGTGESIYRL